MIITFGACSDESRRPIGKNGRVAGVGIANRQHAPWPCRGQKAFQRRWREILDAVVDNKCVDCSADHRDRFANIHLAMPGWMRQRHERLAATCLAKSDIILDYRVAAARSRAHQAAVR